MSSLDKQKGYISDSMLNFVIWTTIISAVALLLLTTWKISESSIGKDCERLGSFYIGHKTYKCEIVNEHNR
jgi:hypothetical protein